MQSLSLNSFSQLFVWQKLRPDSYLALKKVLMQLIITDPTWETEVMTKSTGTTGFYQDLYELYWKYHIMD